MTNPLNYTDSYKVGHHAMYPKGMTHLQSNFTPRSCRIPGVNKVVFFGLQAFIKKILEEDFGNNFFKKDADEVIQEHIRRVEGLLGTKFNADHWYDLHNLGYLPLRFSALPEGTEVPLRVPMFIIENTVTGYGWLVNYIESVLSNTIWQPMTSATIALRLRRLLDNWAQKTSDAPEFVDWQGHDFSFRGMGGVDSGSGSGMGHLLCFAGSDTLSAMDYAQKYYGANGFVGGSVKATEHSVMCAGGKDDELQTFDRLLTQNPDGILSVVSDTWDLWKVITEILPKLKNKIMSRDGKLVIRPDSGDPVDILTGVLKQEWKKEYASSTEEKGVVELLYEIFPGPTNSKGYKTLDPHIGVIYGDSITYERAEQICERLAQKGFATTTPVFGIGSFCYQFNTRDTCGFAMKSTWCQIDGIGHNLFKDPITDNGMKKSAKGRLAVVWQDKIFDKGNGQTLIEAELTLINEATPEQESKSLLKPIWQNGKFIKEYTYREITERVGVRKVLPS